MINASTSTIDGNFTPSNPLVLEHENGSQFNSSTSITKKGSDSNKDVHNTCNDCIHFVNNISRAIKESENAKDRIDHDNSGSESNDSDSEDYIQLLYESVLAAIAYISKSNENNNPHFLPLTKGTNLFIEVSKIV